MRGATKKRRQQTAQLHGAIHCSAPAEQRSGSRAQLEQLVLFSRCTAQQYSMADRPKRRAASRPKLPSASHYVGYVDDSETPEMIAKKFEALERVQAAAAAARAGEVGGGAGGVDAEGAEGGAGAEGAGNQQQEGLTEEQLLEVFKQTSQFTVKTMMTGQDMLLFSALPPSLPRAHPGALRSPRNSLTVLWALLTRCVWRLARHRAAPSRRDVCTCAVRLPHVCDAAPQATSTSAAAAAVTRVLTTTTGARPRVPVPASADASAACVPYSLRLPRAGRDDEDEDIADFFGEGDEDRSRRGPSVRTSACPVPPPPDRSRSGPHKTESVDATRRRCAAPGCRARPRRRLTS